MARRAIENALRGAPDLLADPAVQARIEVLQHEAGLILAAIRTLAQTGADPLTDPQVLALAVQKGILDAPQLRNNPFAPGRVRTTILNGACVTVDEKGQAVAEEERLQSLNFY